MTISMKILNTKQNRTILSVVLISFTGLLSINQSYAGSYYGNEHEYRDNQYQGHHAKKKHRSAHRDGGAYSDSRTHQRNKHRYSKRARGHHYRNRNNHGQHYYRSNHRHSHYRDYYPRYYNSRNYNPRIESYSTNYNSSITYSNHIDPVATIVGGAIGGAIANDISGGDSTATAFGIVTGAVLAGGLGH